MKRIIKIFIICLLALCFNGCHKQMNNDENTTDILYSNKVENETLFIFQMDQNVYMIEPAYQISFPYKDLEDGHFYKITADITYLNGGVAGYVDYPEIDKLTDCIEVSPFKLDLKKIGKKQYGLMYIGEYTDGDIFLNEYQKAAVWKDYKWIYQYDKQLKKDDGTLICYRDGVDSEKIENGIAEGVLSCAEYFVVPAIK